MIHLDKTNQGILDILQREARTSIADIGRTVGRAESTVRERVAALESNGVLRGYHADVDPKAFGYSVRALITCCPELSEVSRIGKEVSLMPNVRGALLTTGDHPLVLDVVASDMTALERFLVDRITPLGIDHINTEIVVREVLAQQPVVAAPRADLDAVPPRHGHRAPVHVVSRREEMATAGLRN